MSRYILLILLLLLNGCGYYSIRNIDKPPPQLHEIWKKQGAAFLEIRKSLLECGQVSLGGASSEIYEKIGIIERKDQINYGFLVDRCMMNAGFVQQNISWTLKDACADTRYLDYPACQPEAAIPKLSIERRLNSWYCKTRRDYDYCLKHALAPQLCSPEKTKTPPRECLTDKEEQLRGAKSNQSTQQTKFAQPTNTYTMGDRNNEQAMQWQRDIQNQNNRRMNEMLKNLQ